MSSESGSDSSCLTTPEHSEDELNEEEATQKRKPRKIKEVPPIEFTEAWEKVVATVGDIEAKKKSVRTRLVWKQVIDALRIEALKNGFDDDQLETLWRVVATNGNHIFAAERRSMIYLLIPKTHIKGDFVKKMCLWTVSSMHTDSAKMKHTVTMMLKYLNGLVEYSLLDSNCFNSQYLYSTLFTLNSHADLLETLCVFLKKVTTKGNFQRFHVTLVLEKYKQTSTPKHKRALHNLLKKYKILRPDYLPDDVFAYPARGKSSSRLKELESLRKLLYEAKRRINGLEANVVPVEESMVVSGPGKDEYDPETVHHHNYFSDLAPAFDNYNLEDVVSGRVCCGPKVVFWTLLVPERLPLFCLNDELLELFESYIGIVLQHKFSQYNGSDNHKYEFVLDRAIQISLLLGHGLPAVDDWLPEFLVEWDMVLWRQQILQLVTYLNPFEFKALHKVVFRKLEFAFLTAKFASSYEIWYTLTQLWTRWLERLKRVQCLVDGGNADHEEERKLCHESADDLCVLMTGFMNKYIAVYVSDRRCEPMIFRFIQTFTKLSAKFNEKRIQLPVVPPLSLLYCIILVDTPRLFDGFSEFLNNTSKWNFNSQKDAMDRLKALRAKFKSFFGSGLPFGELFIRELEESAIIASNEVSQHLQAKLRCWTHESSQTLRIFRSNSQDNPGGLNLAKMKKIAPNLADYYVSIRKDFFPLHASTPVHLGRRVLQ